MNQTAASTRILGLNYRTVSLQSGNIAYIDEGSGPAILLLHGAPLTSLGFLRVIRELRANYRVIAPDFPGFGGSVAAPGFPETLSGYSRFVEEFCRALGLRDFFIFVNDSSACIGFPALAALKDDVAAVIVADTVPLPMTGVFRPVKFALKHIISSSMFGALNRRFNVLPWMVARVAPFLNPFSAAERAVLIRQFDSPEKRALVTSIFGQMARDDDFIQWARRAQAEIADKPVLLLYGQFDPMRLLGAIPRYQRVFPKHSVAIVRREEHFPILASGAEVGRIIHSWIRGLR